MEHIGLILYSCGAAAFLSLAAVIALRRGRIVDPASALAATLGLAAWQAALAWHALQPLPEDTLLGIELGRAALVLLYVFRSIHGSSRNWPNLAGFAVTVSLALLVPVLIGWATPLLPGSAEDFTLRRAWVGVFISLGLLIALEQLFRNTVTPLSLVRYAAITIGITVVYDLYLFSDTLIFERLDPDEWRARGGINALAALFLAIAILRNRITRVVSFSRNVVFYTASLTAAGIFLLTISVLGYAIRRYGGSWGSVLQLMLLFSAVLFVSAAAISQRLRSWLRVYISKNFFALRYDYRQEWLHLIAELSGKQGHEDLYVRAIRVLADLYKCGGGVLWLRQGDVFAPVAPCRMRLPEDCHEPLDSAFCAKLADEWIFEIDVQQRDGVDAPALPAWIPRVPELGILVPLLVESELVGFIGLQRSLGFATLDWEDLEILKTAARQVASDVARFQVAEQLARARQFDTYHQLTAFIMHDLKNLIAQQELVVKNAAKHKENPAFVEDAINTIQNSVARMSALLGKLQQREPSERRPVALQEVLIDALKKCESLRPKPALRIEARELRVLSDRDHLVMILSHLIKNAQEATRDDGFVDVTLRAADGSALIEVEDNGSGMDADFVRNRLFKPFESTKAGKGMGIGAFQAREFVRSLGGDIHVASKPGAGTTFTLNIPLADTVAAVAAGAGSTER